MTAGWTEERIALLATLHAQQLTGGEIGERLGVNRNAVLGQINRLRRRGDPRIRPAASNGPAALRARRIEQLAEKMANGAISVASAGRAMGLTRQAADDLWREIRAGLGAQAQ